jgi:hypothetical protein
VELWSTGLFGLESSAIARSSLIRAENEKRLGASATRYGVGRRALRQEGGLISVPLRAG